MSDDLNDFLTRKGDPEPAAEQPEPQQAPEPAAEAPETDADEADIEEVEARPGDTRRVTLATLEAVRKDWKEKAIRHETEAVELRRQLEEAKRAPPMPPPTPIDFAANPEALVERVQQVVLNERLNTSEMMLRDKIGAEKVDAAVAEFKAAAAADPALMTKLYTQPDPYGWLQKEVERRRAQAEIGDDPAAYKARLRAEWEAEQQTAVNQPASPALAGRAPSLAGVRSAMPRSAPVVTGPTPLSDIFNGR